MASETPLAGKTAVVTGASSGIGRATAEVFARDGADVVLAARRADRLDEVAEAIERSHPGEALAVPTDVTDKDAVDRLLDRTVDEFDEVDIVVNSAGAYATESVVDMSTDAYRRMMRVNVDGVFFVTRRAIPHLVETAGNLIFVGGWGSKWPRPFNPLYVATKWWLRGFALSLAGVVGEEGVAVSLVNPDGTRTEFGTETGPMWKERYGPGEALSPEQVAEAIGFVARQEQPATVCELDICRRNKFALFG